MNIIPEEGRETSESDRRESTVTSTGVEKEVDRENVGVRERSRG